MITNCVTRFSLEFFFLDITNVEHKDLESSSCVHIICNLGGYSKFFSRFFISCIVKPLNIRQYSKS